MTLTTTTAPIPAAPVALQEAPSMHRAPTHAEPRLRENRRRYDQIVAVARRRAARGDLEGVLRSATVAANYAWRAPIGSLTDPDLERLVTSAARGGDASPRVDSARSDGRVLHVLSEAYDLGGHTRLAWRWMHNDPRRSDVALTNQDGPAPEPLRRSAAASGGQLHDLRANSSDLGARATALRGLMDQADVVVHHVHPYDAVALAAAQLPGPRPPIIVENHADFTYWLGLGCADVLADHRVRAQRLSHELRGVRYERLGLLPLPVDDPPVAQAVEGTAARMQLGLRPEDIVAVSVASAPKMSAVWGQGFDALLAQVLSAHPRLKVVLVGPPPRGVWAALAARFHGRLFPLGVVADPAPWYAAADIYLNPYPLPGGTSVLEAAISGLPVVSLRDMTGRYGHAELYQADSPGLAGIRHASATEDEYQSALRKLVRDADLRAQRGAAARAAVLAAHTGPGWSRALEALYDRARAVAPADLDEYQHGIEDLGYGAMLLPMVSSIDKSPEVAEATEPLRAQLDQQLSFDLFAAAQRSEGASLSVRVSSGWETDPAWTTRLLALAGQYPRLAVSLPFAAGDDSAGSRSIGHLTALLDVLGTTTSDCGDISLDPAPPVFSSPAVSGELALTAQALDMLEALVSSPSWEDPVAASPVPV